MRLPIKYMQTHTIWRFAMTHVPLFLNEAIVDALLVSQRSSIFSSDVLPEHDEDGVSVLQGFTLAI